MRTAIVVPARYASTRYPGKPLVPLKGPDGTSKSLIQRSWEAAVAVEGIDRVVVATDDPRIADAVRAFGGEVEMTPSECRNGTERCAAVGGIDDCDIIVNLQGDAPLTPAYYVADLVTAMQADPSIQVATPALRATPDIHRRLLADQQAGRVGGTTAVVARNGDALYFSKAVIPHVPADKIGHADAPVFLHVGVYAYRRAALDAYGDMHVGRLETLEGLEQLRFLEHGIPVRLVEVPAPDYDLWELNNPEDVAPIEAALARRGVN
ncbi:manno-octulosonate cytidylyltransferase [uncultured Sphingomonas sp.]|uniref:3-deoxy-manno-octulosonate cytidylyltransferase n=1 Tax=uncultured Sphingomonas sp. TaxID=158754 RepID=UPI0025E86F6C|nr:manno-octulosonate cytidylyltransferase [uncultured Sphingomonas sp.]